MGLLQLICAPKLAMSRIYYLSHYNYITLPWYFVRLFLIKIYSQEIRFFRNILRLGIAAASPVRTSSRVESGPSFYSSWEGQPGSTWTEEIWR